MSKEKPMQANNMAAMREALELFAHMNDDGYYDGSPVIKNIVEKAKAALAAPPRNCDRFTDAESARRAWLDDEDIWDEFGSPKLKLYEWLFAPATEQKREAEIGRPAADATIRTLSNE